MKISGVYSITNNITGELYIGSSHDVKKRWAQHKCLSVWKRYTNSRLYKDMSQYGLDNFIFEVLEETDTIKEKEQYWIEQLKPTYNSIRANGHDTERYRAYRQAHRNERLAKTKDWHKVHRDEQLKKIKDYYSRLCLYEGETLTLNALRSRLRRQGIPHPTLEAMNYLL